jgi:O-antigen ligase
MLAVSLALVISPSFIVALPFMLTVVMQVNLRHSPGVPTWSDYYYTPGKLVTIIILTLILLLALIFFVIKNVIPRVKCHTVSKIPLFYPLAALSVAFLMNGIGGEWTLSGIIYAIAQIAVYVLLFYIVLYGLMQEKTDALLERLSYLALLVAAVIIGEMIFMFATYNGIFENGSLVKERINLGWAIWNPIGFSLTVIIPLLMRGAMLSRRWWLYLLAAVCTWGSAVLTLSRNSLIFATLTLGACMIIACFKGQRKSAFRIITAVALLLAALSVILLWSKISSLLGDIINRGFSDNGRFEVWRIGLKNFTEAPIFGKGFFSYGKTEVFEVAKFIPTLAHNTLIELLSACGIVGLLAYFYYRASTVVYLVKHPSFDKLMLSLPIIVTLGMSLIDNYVFHIYTTFTYSICLAIIFKLSDERGGKDNEN